MSNGIGSGRISADVSFSSDTLTVSPALTGTLMNTRSPLSITPRSVSFIRDSSFREMPIRRWSTLLTVQPSSAAGT